MSLPIIPETTVGALLEAYPEVEGVLVEMAPAFGKLRNPVVRRTVAKVATLEQAARIGGINLKAMILRLRDFTGQSSPDLPVLQPRPDAGDDASWLTSCRVIEEIDAEAMLERGVHPIGKVREAVERLVPGEVVVLRSSFRPQPLIETLRRAGAAVHSSTQGATHSTWFGPGEVCRADRRSAADRPVGSSERSSPVEADLLLPQRAGGVHPRCPSARHIAGERGGQ